MTHPAAEASVWVLADPRAGTAAQALGIAERLERPFRTVPLAWGRLARLPWPWPSLAGLTPGARAGIAPPWPKLVISAGRRAAPVALWLGRRGARTVHCMRPGFGAARFDLLVVGRHDAPAPAPNLMPILGATHRMSPARLAAARSEWAELGRLPGPRVALLVGGRVRGEGLDLETAASLVPAARRHFPGATFLATTSRRTGSEATARIAADLRDLPHRLFRWGDAGPNPIAGFLAWADAVIVTADSVSMLSEACATGRPVLVAGEAPGRHAALARSLYEAGYASPISAPGLPHPPAPLDESGRVAARLREAGFA
ncbi:mitochondrial fission ELM1 family protein [Roseomonas marmotae]|uniref:Mitochondrial fission ELM1 family protein n=1 Tax=Roseomonas marmotae TaxID=2768161 RepID=A0ABS3KBU1_9PROT|nr:mitochondrial fission ELM1 family protein [Roseomonas marmotae]MBO1074118.1 mitochondrial fission ELM1 family protein [Roseomonas marmotae]QTI78900.1 mitochondrial fission ELM1 family protein [Roseomonas marmotae]